MCIRDSYHTACAPQYFSVSEKHQRWHGLDAELACSYACLLYTSHHSSVKRQSPDMAQGDGDDMEGRSETRQALHAIALKEFIGVALSTDCLLYTSNY